jgi:membrane protease YdiL (CAAX protease family)
MTRIGTAIQGRAAKISLFVGLATVALDWWLIWLDRYPESHEGRWALALLGCLMQLRLANGDLASIGLVAPRGGWRRWLQTAGCLLIVAAALGGIVFTAWSLSDKPLPKHLLARQNLRPALVPMCILAPLLEESLYRAVLCVGVAAVLGDRWAIAASGVAFALLHVFYGNPSPENLLGGFVLGWAFLRSGSLFVPLLLHAGGNAVVWLVHVGAHAFLIDST